MKILRKLNSGKVHEIKIEKDIRIPDGYKHGQELIPFSTMKKGDSVFIPEYTMNSASSSVHRQKRKMSNKNKQWVCRTTKDMIDGEYTKGIRIWRAK